MATITASMSTIAWREPGLARAVASILPQVDRLNVFLQKYMDTPAHLDDPRIVIVRDTAAPESAALGASAKYHWLWAGEVADGYHFAVDDDIEYPDDYVQTCVRRIDEYGRRVIVGYHGAIYKPRVVNYFKDRTLWAFDKANDCDRFVHMLGTGTTAQHTSTMRLTREDFAQGNSCDLYLGIAAQRQRVPMLCLARHERYLKPLPLASDPRAASGPSTYATRMAEIHASIPEWKIYTTEPVASDGPVVVVVPCYNESVERIERTIRSALATPGVDLVRVVDDGSEDPVTLEPRDRLEVIRRDRNGGPSAAMNTGARSLPVNSIICRLDVGDVFYPEPKSRQIAMVRAGARAVCSWHYDPVHDRTHRIADDWKERIFRDCQFSSTATVFSKVALLECGGFDETLRWCEDWRFCVAMQVHVGWTVLPEATGEHGEHPGGHSDVKRDPKKRKRRSLDRIRVVNIVAALGEPDRHAHLFDETWAHKRGLKPLKKPPVRKP